MDTRLMSEKDAIICLIALRKVLEKNIPDFSDKSIQDIVSIIKTIEQCGFGQSEPKTPKKVFISQPMRGLSNDEIVANRQKAIEVIKNNLGEVEIINSVLNRDELAKNGDFALSKNSRVYFLGESLKLLSQADCVVFLDGYKEMNGCLCEEFVARQYGIQSYQLIGDELRPIQVIGVGGINSCQMGSIEVTQ